MNFPTHIETRRLNLRPVGLDDALAIFKGYAGDPRVTRYVSWKTHSNLDDTKKFVAAAWAGWREGSIRDYAITWKDMQIPIGTVRIRREQHKVAIGYVLQREVWGNGLMTEIVRWWSDWFLQAPALRRFEAYCDIENLASKRVMTKAGMEVEGVLRKWHLAPNYARLISPQPRDCWMCARTKP